MPTRKFWGSFMSKKDQAFSLFDQGKKPSSPEVKQLGLKPKTSYNYFQEFKHSGGAGQIIETMTGKETPATVGAKVLKGGLPVTDALSQTAYLQLIPHVQQLPLTVPIFVSYLCAVKSGYEGDVADWLSLVSLDFWQGRGRNMYAEVGGISSSEDKGKK